MRIFTLFVAAALALAAAPVRFRISLSADVAPKGAAGRLFVFLQKGDSPVERIRVGFVPEDVWLAAAEVRYWKAGETIEFNPDDLAFPRPFSQAERGSYRVMALLDPDHSFARERQGAGDLVSAVKVVADLNPADAAPVELALTAVTPGQAERADTANVKAVHFVSPSLSAFFGRPVTMHAGVVLPNGHTAESAPLPAVYHVHGFGGSYREAWARGEQLPADMAAGTRLRAVHVYLDGNCPGGHHVFADSVNNGPWGKALTEELIPHLEKRFGLAAAPRGRFLTGHSSGGWSSLWLQVKYPDFFGGTWPTAPDSMDFRNFTGIDATPESAGNAYRNKDGGPLNLVRMGGREVLSVEEFARMERVTGEYGGQLASFDWVFSPRGADGRPMRMFHWDTGEMSREVREHWQRYDIARIVRDNWATLGPKLVGKIRLTIGAVDNCHLNEAAERFCGWLREKGREDACEIVPGRDHFNLHRPHDTYPKGLTQRIDDEMRAKWEAAQPR